MGKAASKLKKRKNTLQWSRLGSFISLKHHHISRSQTQDDLPNPDKLPIKIHSTPTTPILSRALPAIPQSPTTNKKQEGPHRPIREWLEALELLEQYGSIFEEFNGVEEIIEFSEAKIKEMGVKNSAHRARIVSSLTALRQKYHKNTTLRRKVNSFRHSVAVDTRKQHLHGIDKSDLRVVTESAQSKSLCDLIMEPTPVADESALRRALEWELSLDARDLRSHAWYHGSIPRPRAEEIVRADGEFLVRDCSSQPGNYVLTTRVKGQALHFVINKVVLQPETVYERVQYQFEEDAYDTVADLITFYVGSGKHVTVASGARIQYPRNRMYPLSFYATRYPQPPPIPPSYPGSRIVSPVGNTSPAFRYSTMQPQRPSCSPTRRDGAAPRLPTKKQRSQSLTPSEVTRQASQEKCNSADGIIQSPLMTRSAGPDQLIMGSKFSTHSLPRTTCNKMSLSPSTLSIGRNSKLSESSLSPCSEGRPFSVAEDDSGTGLSESPPPKPSRLPCIARPDSDIDRSDSGFLPHGSLQRVASYHASGSDSGNGSGDSAQSSAAGDSELNHKVPGVIIKNPRYVMVNSDSTITLKNLDFDYLEAEEKLMQIQQPELFTTSRFDIENFTTLLLPVVENKPLDSKALRSIKITLQDNAPRILANHLTKCDLDLLYGDWCESGEKLKNISGIELCGLPHGHQLRMDIIERTECLKLLVAVTILTCPNDFERAEILNKWIEIAIDTKTALGNLYGFCGVMLGLCMPQIQRLDSTWHTLRQKYTDSAFNFEAKLRPTLKSMNECSNPQAPNTTIPHILPFVLLQERSLEELNGVQNELNSSLSSSCLQSWENHSQDFGLHTLLAHLQAARKYSENLPTYKRTAEIVFGDFNRTEELILDTFKTEFHMKFLWGSRGALAPAQERHLKFEQVLSVMADKFCSADNEGTPV